ncbi:MAG: TonB-dependent receptor [Bacteroidetes bacterium]|nr:TonB-dependent receptor [Bacteroidota bacterium]
MKKYLFIVLLWPYFALAQQTLKLTIGPEKEALSHAHYVYGTQKGTANEQGIITLKPIEGASLEITHLSSGYQLIGPEELKSALAAGELQLARGTGYQLQPVTVIALRPSKPQQELLPVGYYGAIAHDAGAFLLSNPVVAGIRKSGAYGVDPVLRGFKYDQINIILDDGHTALAACPNRMDPPASQIPMNMTGSVEILKGPHVLRYGNTTGGTIHFRSNPPEFSDHLAPMARVTIGYESNGEIVRSELMAGINSRNIQAQLFGTVSQGGSYTSGKGDEIPAAFYRQSAGARISAKPAGNQLLQINVFNNRARDTDFPSLPMDLRSDNTWMLNLRHELESKEQTFKALRTQVNASMVDHVMDNLTRLINSRTMDARTLAQTSFAGFRSEGEFSFGKGVMFAGIDARSETSSGERTRKMLMGPMAGKEFKDNIWQDAVVNRSGLFAEYRQSFGAYNFVGAMRLEYLSARAGKADDKFSSTYTQLDANQLFPSLSAGASRLLNPNFSVSLWLSRSMRGAGIAERYINFLPIGLDPYEIVGNPSLKPEVNHQADIELQYRNKGLFAVVSIFGTLLNDYISQEKTDMQPRLPSSPGVRQFRNIDRASMTGFEFQLKSKLPASLTAGLQMAYVRGQNLSLEEPLPEIAPLDARIFLHGSYAKGKLTPELSLRTVGKQSRISNNFGETETPGFTLVDLAVSYQIANSFYLKLSGTNLLNENYYEHLSRAMRVTTPPTPLYAPGRSLNVLLNYRLN